MKVNTPTKLLFFIGLIVFVQFYGCKEKHDEISLDVFKNDQQVIALSIQLHEFNLLNQGVHTENAAREHIFEMIKTAKIISTRYGQQQALSFAKTLAQQTDAKLKNNAAQFLRATDYDKCHRKSDGTTDWTDCNIWESVVVLLSSAVNCDQPAAGASRSEIESYYNCIQSTICKNC